MRRGNSAAQPAVESETQWAAEDLDLEAYLDRIGLPESVAQRPDVDALAHLHRRHIDTFPFENVDHVLGNPVDVSMCGLNEKLVCRRRGGHCVELNLLFAAALQRLGYAVTRRAARVSVPGRPSARSHTILYVSAGDETWLADTAFSPGLLAPVPLRPGAQVEQGGKTYEVTQDAHGEWALRVVSPEVRELYRFTDEYLNWFDFDMIATWGAHNPASPISGDLFVARRTENAHLVLRGTTFTTTDRAGNRNVQGIDALQLPKLLGAEFGVHLSGAETATLIERELARGAAPTDLHGDSEVQKSAKEETSVR